jgi:hypothetical protein
MIALMAGLVLLQGDGRFRRRRRLRAAQAEHEGRSEPDANGRQSLAKAAPRKPTIIQLFREVIANFDIQSAFSGVIDHDLHSCFE